MSGALYRKEGTALVLARIGGMASVATTREAGMAGVRAGRFFSASADAAGEEHPADVDALLALDRAITDGLPRGVSIERAQIVAGETAHAIVAEGTEDVRWSERHVRARVELVADSTSLRVAVVRGGERLDAIAAEEIAAVARLMARAGSGTGPGSSPLLLAPAVAAALTRALADRAESLPPSIPLVQAEHPAWPRDGAGAAIARFEAAGRERRSWPNVYRPSYRSPAVPAILHAELALEADAAPAEGTARAVEVVDAATLRDGAVQTTVLVESASGVALERLRLPLGAIAAMRRIGGTRAWFPFGAGCWGRELLAP